MRFFPMKPPSTGMKISAISNDAISTAITVIGKYCINCPTMPGQNNSGINTIKVVIVDEIIGHAMRCAPILYLLARVYIFMDGVT